jgi:hypothetical protein
VVITEMGGKNANDFRTSAACFYQEASASIFPQQSDVIHKSQVSREINLGGGGEEAATYHLGQFFA